MKSVLLATVFSVAISFPVLAGNTNSGTNNGFQISNTGTLTNSGKITNNVNTGVITKGSYNTTNNANSNNVMKTNSDNKTTITKNSNVNSRRQSNSAEGGVASSEGGTANAYSGSVTIQGNKRVFNAPDLGGLPSGPCTGVSGGFTIGTPVFGGGVQGGGLDDQCTLRENIRIVNALNPELAREMTKDLKGVKEALQRISERQGLAVRPESGVEITRVASRPTDWSDSHTH